MTAFLQDALGDLALTNNRMHLTDGKTQTMQAVRSNLRVWQGECFLDVTAGTPYFQAILGKAKNQRAAEAAIKSVILNTSGVTGLLEFSFTVDNATRTASIAFKASSLFGVIELNEVL